MSSLNIHKGYHLPAHILSVHQKKAMAKRKYSKAAQEKVGEVMKEFKEGKLKSSSGDKVTNRKQAIAIGISEAKQEGLKVPQKPKAPVKKKK